MKIKAMYCLMSLAAITAMSAPSSFRPDSIAPVDYVYRVNNRQDPALGTYEYQKFAGKVVSTVSGENTILDYTVQVPQFTPSADHPVSAPEKLIFVVVHGLKDHMGHYDDLIRNLQEYSTGVKSDQKYMFETWAYDQPHHGLTGINPGNARCDRKKPSGDVDSIGENVGHLRNFLQMIATERAGVPIVLFGHSMGGLVVASYLEQYGAQVRFGTSRSVVKAAVLSAPALLTFSGWFEDFKKSTIKAIGSQVPHDFPAIPDFLSNTDFFSDTRDADAPSAIYVIHKNRAIYNLKRDPLVNSGLHSIPTAEAMIDGIDAFQARLNQDKFRKNLNVPVFLLHSAHDKITNPQGSIEFYNVLTGSGVGSGAAQSKLNVIPGIHFHDVPGLYQPLLAPEITDWLWNLK